MSEEESGDIIGNIGFVLSLLVIAGFILFIGMVIPLAIFPILEVAYFWIWQDMGSFLYWFNLCMLLTRTLGIVFAVIYALIPFFTKKFKSWAMSCYWIAAVLWVIPLYQTAVNNLLTIVLEGIVLQLNIVILVFGIAFFVSMWRLQAECSKDINSITKKFKKKI